MQSRIGIGSGGGSNILARTVYDWFYLFFYHMLQGVDYMSSHDYLLVHTAAIHSFINLSFNSNQFLFGLFEIQTNELRFPSHKHE